MDHQSKKIKLLVDTLNEVNRFKERLTTAIQEQTYDKYAHKHYAAAKRGALDLKNELTKLTQDSKTLYQQERTPLPPNI
jgi:hypothetical protein